MPFNSRSAPNGVTTNHAYDGLDRLTSLTHAKGALTVIGNQYTYNDANNISSWANAAGNHAYDYDPLDRLTGASNSAQPNENYSYDEVGNRTKSDFNGGYSYEPVNRLVKTGDANYSYDNNGNLLSKEDGSGTTTFTWNEENQLTQVRLPNGVVNYKYDGLGRRIQRTANGADERYVYDGADVLLDLNANSSVATTYLNGPGIDNHLRQTSATTGVSYFLTDHLGSTSGLTDASGNLVEQIAYDSFGNSTGSTRTRYTYTGRERDPDTGLLHYRARFYDPQVGRFISEDPIGFRGRDVNLYGYVRNNPLRFIDSGGMRRCHPFVGAVVGGLTGFGVGALGGGGLGAIGGALAGAAGGTFVIPGFGTVVGAGGGAAGGAAVGAFVGSGIGTGIGIQAGINYCNADDVCDTSPRAVPQPTPNAAPMPPPPPVQPDGEQTCRRLLELCLSNPWQPGWNRGFGPRKDCGACYRQCKNNGGAWPFEKCPIFHN